MDWLSKLKESLGLVEKCMEDMPMMAYPKAPQDVAQYEPMGGAAEKACINCLFFQSPDGCAVVVDYPIPINPSGVSRYWTAVPAMHPSPMPVMIMGDMSGDMDKAAWDTAYINALPDSAFAVIEPGGKKDEEGKTIPRSLRKLPHHNADGSIDLPHLRNAMARMSQTDMPENMMGRAQSHLEAHAQAEGIGGRKDSSRFSVFKDARGNWRWLALVTNKFRDHDTPPEILTEEAHKEFVAWLESPEGEYPEAWLWHTPGTKWGQGDWAEYIDGFVVMSGTVDPGQESVAEALSGRDTSVSHGFYPHYSDKDIIDHYRMFELSALPRGVEANPWTGMELIKKEAQMAMDPRKREYLASLLGEERVALLEKDVGELSKALTDSGIEYKEIRPALTAEDVAVVVTKALETQWPVLTTALAENVAQVAQKVNGVAEKVASMEERLAALEKSDDEKVASYFEKARDKGGYRASQSKETVVEKDDDLSKGSPNNDGSWFKDVVEGALRQPVAAAVQDK